MKSNDIHSNEHALEIKAELVKQKVISDDMQIETYQQLRGGADTTIFEITFKNHPQKYLQRIIRAGYPYRIAEVRFLCSP